MPLDIAAAGVDRSEPGILAAKVDAVLAQFQRATIDLPEIRKLLHQHLNVIGVRRDLVGARCIASVCTPLFNMSVALRIFSMTDWISV